MIIYSHRVDINLVTIFNLSKLWILFKAKGSVNIKNNITYINFKTKEIIDKNKYVSILNKYVNKHFQPKILYKKLNIRDENYNYIRSYKKINEIINPLGYDIKSYKKEINSFRKIIMWELYRI